MTITLIVPAYNEGPFIERCINSTDDKCFENGAVGRYIRERFTEPSRWES